MELLMAALLVMAVSGYVALPADVHTRKATRGVAGGMKSGHAAARTARGKTGKTRSRSGSGSQPAASSSSSGGSTSSGSGSSARRSRGGSLRQDFKRATRGIRTGYRVVRAFGSGFVSGYKASAAAAATTHEQKRAWRQAMWDGWRDGHSFRHMRKVKREMQAEGLEPSMLGRLSDPALEPVSVGAGSTAAPIREADDMTTAPDLAAPEDVGEFVDPSAMADTLEGIGGFVQTINAAHSHLLDLVHGFVSAYESAEFSTDEITSGVKAMVESISEEEGSIDFVAMLESIPPLMEALNEASGLGEHGAQVGAEGSIERFRAS